MPISLLYAVGTPVVVRWDVASVPLLYNGSTISSANSCYTIMTTDTPSFVCYVRYSKEGTLMSASLLYTVGTPVSGLCVGAVTVYTGRSHSAVSSDMISNQTVYAVPSVAFGTSTVCLYPSRFTQCFNKQPLTFRHNFGK